MSVKPLRNTDLEASLIAAFAAQRVELTRDCNRTDVWLYYQYGNYSIVNKGRHCVQINIYDAPDGFAGEVFVGVNPAETAKCQSLEGVVVEATRMYYAYFLATSTADDGTENVSEVISYLHEQYTEILMREMERSYHLTKTLESLSGKLSNMSKGCRAIVVNAMSALRS